MKLSIANFEKLIIFLKLWTLYNIIERWVNGMGDYSKIMAKEDANLSIVYKF